MFDAENGPSVSFLQLRAAPFSQFMEQRKQWMLQQPEQGAPILTRMGRAGASFSPDDGMLVISPAMADEAKRLNFAVESRGFHVRKILGPDEITLAAATAIADRTGRSIVFERRRLLMYLDNPPLFKPASEGRFRRAVEADVQELVGLFLEAFRDELVDFQVETSLRNRLETANAYVWDIDGPKAYACYGNSDLRTVEISSVMTSKAFTSRGLASNMIGEMTGPNSFALGRRGRAPTLLVDENNARARSIYEKLGFKPIGWWRFIVLSGNEAITST